MAVHIAGNLKELIYDSAAGYINLNVDKFKSTTPGPIGPTGPIGPQGEGVHHMKGTSTTDPEGDFSTAGELDTYTFYADADELFPLAWFTVKNGEDPWRRAVDRGYRGTEEEFYTALGSIEEYATIALESINITEKNKQIVLAAAAQVAADKLIVEEARDIAVEKSDIAKESSDAVQIIFLGAKSVDPVVDNQGNPLVTGVMYYNDVIGQLKLWHGTEWTTAAFSADGAVFSFNGRVGAVNLTNSDITIAVGRNVAAAFNSIESSISNVDNTADVDKSVLSATKLTTARNINGVGFDGTADIVIADNTKVALTEKGVANGVATLDADGKIPTAQIPVTVDSVNGRTGQVVLINNDITTAVGKDLTDAIKYSEADKVLTDVNKVNLSTDTNLVASAGQITWNPNERTADIGLDNNVVLQVGQETVVLVRNGTGVSISDGTVVMLTGSIGNSGRLVVAPYDGVSDASLILGITTEAVAAGSDGFVTSYGKIRGIDTSMWNDGDVLYVNGGGGGLGLTPTSSLSMKIAVVVHSHTNGTLMVRVNGYSQVKEW